MSLACGHYYGLPQSPNPQAQPQCLLSMPRGSLQFQKGTESNRQQLVRPSLKKNPLTGMESLSAESRHFLICGEKQQEQLKVSNQV